MKRAHRQAALAMRVSWDTISERCPLAEIPAARAQWERDVVALAVTFDRLCSRFSRQQFYFIAGYEDGYRYEIGWSYRPATSGREV
jgi:hypothetical protein